MELDKELIERFRAKFGISTNNPTKEWITDGDNIVGLPHPDLFDKNIFLNLGRFRLKRGIDRKKKRTIGLFNSEGIKSGLLFGAMTVVRRRRILELGLYKGHLPTISNGGWMVVIAPVMGGDGSLDPYDLDLSELISERDIRIYKEAILWFKMLKRGE